MNAALLLAEILRKLDQQIVFAEAEMDILQRTSSRNADVQKQIQGHKLQNCYGLRRELIHVLTLAQCGLLRC